MDVKKLIEDVDSYADEYDDFLNGHYGRKIRKIRYTYGMQHEEFAELVGCEADTIEQWEIEVDEYTEDDLNYNDSNSRATIEQNDSSIRPEIDGTIDNWDQYSVIVIGHPIWWGQEPRIMNTFVESYDFTGKTVTTFCTSASSGIGNSGENLETNANAGIWLAGRRFAKDSSLEEIQEWIEELAIIE